MMEPEEAALQTAIREVFEEVGYAPSNLKLFAQTVDVDGRNELIHIFVGRIDVPISALALNEGTDIGYFSQSEMMHMRLIPFVNKSLGVFFQYHAIS